MADPVYQYERRLEGNADARELPVGEWPALFVVACCDQVFQNEFSAEDRALAAMGKWCLRTYRPLPGVDDAESVLLIRCFVHSVATTPKGEFLLNWYHNSGVAVENVYAGLPSIFEAWVLTIGPWMRAALRYGIAWKDEELRRGVFTCSPEELECHERIYEASPWHHASVLQLHPWDGGVQPTAFGYDPDGRSPAEYRMCVAPRTGVAREEPVSDATYN